MPGKEESRNPVADKDPGTWLPRYGTRDSFSTAALLRRELRGISVMNGPQKSNALDILTRAFLSCQQGGSQGTPAEGRSRERRLRLIGKGQQATAPSSPAGRHSAAWRRYGLRLLLASYGRRC